MQRVSPTVVTGESEEQKEEQDIHELLGLIEALDADDINRLDQFPDLQRQIKEFSDFPPYREMINEAIQRRRLETSHE